MHGPPVSSVWHRFVASSDDDLECVNSGCGAIVDEQSLRLLSVGCPVRPCGDDGNSGSCVFVAAEIGPECAYCGAFGSHRDLDDDDEDDDEP